MKTTFIILMISWMSTSMMIGQTDKQWSIKKGEGIYQNPQGALVYNNTTLTGTDYCFHGFEHPVVPFLSTTTNTFVTPKNDIFIIYQDGNFFNSYSETNWMQNTSTTNEKDYQVSSSHLIPIQHLYWTNRYEGDDITGISVTNPPSTSCGFPEDISVGTNSDVTYFNVNHDIVGGRDVTVIVKAQNVDCFNYTLNFNSCLDSLGNVVQCPGLLTYDTSIFTGSNNIISNDNPVSGSIKLNFNQLGIAYANFRVTRNTHDNYSNKMKHRFQVTNSYLPGSVSDKCGENLPTTFPDLEIAINSSHDPNYMQLMSICPYDTLGNGTDYFFNFYAQVQNTGTSPADNVTLEIPIPAMFDINEVFINRIYYNGNPYYIGDQSFTNTNFEINQANRMLIVNFMPTALNAYNPNTPFNSVAAVDFCLKPSDQSYIPSGDDPSIFPPLAQSTFSEQDYDIDTFIGLERCTTSENCDCGFGYKVKKCNSFWCWIQSRPNWFGLACIGIIGLIIFLKRRRP